MADKYLPVRKAPEDMTYVVSSKFLKILPSWKDIMLTYTIVLAAVQSNIYVHTFIPSCFLLIDFIVCQLKFVFIFIAVCVCVFRNFKKVIKHFLLQFQLRFVLAGVPSVV